MTTVADPLLPRPTGGLAGGAAISVAVHLALLAALTFGVRWRASAPDTVSAELWSAVPEVAAPPAEQPVPVAPAPPPPPPPAVARETPPPPAPPADIATERDRKARELEKQKAAEERDKAAKADKARQAELQAELQKKREADEQKKREQQAEQARLDKLRADQIKRMQGNLAGTGSPGSTGTAARDSGPSAGYAAKLVALLRSNVQYNPVDAGNPEAEIRVSVAPGGTILARRLVTSSGVKDWDEAALRAIDRTGRLPPDTDGTIPATITIRFRPKE